MKALRKDVEKMRDAFRVLEVRMIGASLLIIYEAEWERCRVGLERLEERRRRVADGEDEDEDEDEEDEDEDEDEDEENKKPGPAYVVKLIDFAHTRLVPGKGPDEGVLMGFETMLRLLDGRIQEIGSLSGEESPSEPAESA